MVRTHGLWRALIVSGIVLASLDMLYAFLPAWAADNAVSVSPLSVGCSRCAPRSPWSAGSVSAGWSANSAAGSC